MNQMSDDSYENIPSLYDIVDLEVKDTFYITGRGECVVVDLPDGVLNKDLRKLYMSKLFKHKGQLWQIAGIEYQGGPDREAQKTAFLLREFNIGSKPIKIENEKS